MCASFGDSHDLESPGYKGKPYCWFAYDVIKNMIMQIMIEFQNSDMTCNTIKRVSVPTKTSLQAKGVGEFSIMLYGKMGWGCSLAHQQGCRNINVWRFSKL